MKKIGPIALLMFLSFAACTNERAVETRPAPTGVPLLAAANPLPPPLAAQAITGTSTIAINPDSARRALAIDDPKVANYGARLRLTTTMFDFIKYSVRDMFGEWSYPRSGGNGFNLKLDGGYDYTSHTAGGGIRTTPVAFNWSWTRGSCSCGLFCGSCQMPYPENGSSGQMVPNRRPGAAGTACNRDDTVNGNQRGFPTANHQANQREHGFYVSDGSLCYTALNLCSPGVSATPQDYKTPYQINESSALYCDVEPIHLVESIISTFVYINIGAFIYPTGHIENGIDQSMKVSGAGDPTNFDPPDRWNYTGNLWKHNANKRGWGTTSNSRESCCGGGTIAYHQNIAGAFPRTDGTDYVYTDAYHKRFGSYFRQGDDTAIYMNVGRMQIHSANRDAISAGTVAGGGTGDALAVNDCGEDYVYTGQVNAAAMQPTYTLIGKVPNCVRPLMYWHTSNKKWTACNPFDTFLADGSVNPDSDDAKAIYPGNIGWNGAVASGSNPLAVCGAQHASDRASPWTGPGRTGRPTGWTTFDITRFAMVPNDDADVASRNAIALELRSDNWRIEIGVWADAWLESPTWPVGSDSRRNYGYGFVKIDNVIIKARLKMRGIDNTSCEVAGGACESPVWWPGANWLPTDDGLTAPDRFDLFLDIDPVTDIQINGASFIGEGDCFIEVVGICAFQTVNVINIAIPVLVDQIKAQVVPLLVDLVGNATAELPNLSALLGGPARMGNVLMDMGIFPAGNAAAKIKDSATDRDVWPFWVQNHTDAGRQVLDGHLSVGFWPLAFKSASAGTYLLADPTKTDPLPDNAFFGVPTMYDPDTTQCFFANGSGYTYTPLAGTAFAYNSISGNISNMTFTAATGNYFDLLPGSVFIHTASGVTSTVVYVGTRKHTNGTVTPNALVVGKGLSMPTGAFQFAQGRVVLSGLADSYYVSTSPNRVRAGQILVDSATGQEAVIAAVDYVNKRFTIRAYPSNFPGGASRAWKISNCSRLRAAQLDEDQQYDFEDYVVGGSFTEPRSGEVYVGVQRIQENWGEPLIARLPDWCPTPNQILTEIKQLKTRYPITTWTSVDPALDAPPASSGLANSGLRNTVGAWDAIPPPSGGFPGVVKRNQNNPLVRETTDVPFDLSLQMHQQTLNQLGSALVGSGALCLELGPQDPETGEDTPFKDFLRTDRFAAFIPEINNLFSSDSYVSVRIIPRKAPHIRTGIGTAVHTPRLWPGDPYAPAAINDPFTLGVAIPDLEIAIIVHDPALETPVTLLRINWNTTVGVFARFMRQCYHLDPMNGLPECESTDNLIRTISGYVDVYVEMNSPTVSAVFENNAYDGFATGRFSNSEFVCPECSPATAPGQAQFELLESYCTQTTAKCDVLGLSNLIPTMLESLLNFYFVSRISIPNLPMDFLYVGPDGPNDDGLGQGDALGFYVKLLGNLDVFDLLGSLAPKLSDLRPQAVLSGIAPDAYVITNRPRFAVAAPATVPDGPMMYSYRVDNGFWHPPAMVDEVTLGALTEGRHTFEVRGEGVAPSGNVPTLRPVALTFYVDTVPPKVSIEPSTESAYQDHINIATADVQTPSERLKTEYHLGDGAWKPLVKNRISLRGVKPGRYSLTVRSTDLAGNAGLAARNIAVATSGWGCGSARTGAWEWLLVPFLVFAFRRLRYRVGH